MILDREFVTRGHVFPLAVEEADAGWDVQERCDAAVVYIEHHLDWHRVELAMDRLQRECLRHCPNAARPSPS